jgi:2-dehydro-3-deoxyphosphogluconate aldolase/(4S)-4-hydroxy-2-oxoglutarate aldolase
MVCPQVVPGGAEVAKHKRLDVYNATIEIGMVPVFYNGDIEIAKEIAHACVEGGVRVLEFTNRGDHAFEVFSELESHCAKELPDAILGTGSVIDPGTASLYISLGSCFIVGPVTNPDVAKLCNRRKIGYVPGCGTGSEISYAEELGAEFVKIFPGTAVGGPGFVRDLLAPMPWSSIIPTGGVDVTRESLEGWFKAGVAAVGMGSRLVSRDIVADRDWAKLTQRCMDTVALIKEIRGH